MYEYLEAFTVSKANLLKGIHWIGKQTLTLVLVFITLCNSEDNKRDLNLKGSIHIEVKYVLIV